MKKIALLLVVMLLLGVAPMAYAEILGVTLISGPEAEAAPARLDDMKQNVPAEIPNYATVTITSAEFFDEINYDSVGWGYTSGGINQYWQYKSGEGADFFLLYMDILNVTAIPTNYTKSLSVTVMYKDSFIYEGFVYQANYDLRANYRSFTGNFPFKNEATNEIGPFYVGHYAIGCTLPNAVINDKSSPLQMTIMLGEHEIIYNIRK